MKNKKIHSITVIANDYPAPNHMKLVFVQQLVHAIIEQGVKVTVVAPQSIIRSVVHKEKLLPKKSIGHTNSGIEYDIYRPFSLSMGKYKYLKKIIAWFNKSVVAKKIKQVNSDVLYAHFWGSAKLVHEYALKNKIPLFVACGESGDLFTREFNDISSKTIIELQNATTGIISVSSENKLKCKEYSLSKSDNIEIFPNCIQADIFRKIDTSETKKELGIDSDDLVLSFVGGFIPRKGPERVAEAISKLNDPKIKVMFIGKPLAGYEYDFDCPGIIHKGPLNHDLLPKYLNCSDVFVLPTQSEGCCNAIVEALAIGLPVISSEGAFNDDILDEYNSIRINPNDIDAIASAIKRLKDDVMLRKQMSEYSLSRHNEYSIEERAKKILNFINEKV